MSTSTYPVVYHQTPAVERSRSTVFFRFIMVFPHLIWGFFYGLAAWVGVFIALVCDRLQRALSRGHVRARRRIPALHDRIGAPT